MDFSKLYVDHYDLLKRTAMSFLRNEEDAEDAVQETFLKAFESVDTYDGTSSVSTWLTQICINTARDKLRKRKTEMKHKTPLLEEGPLLDSREDTASPELFLEAKEEEAKILSEYSQLPDSVKTALTLRLVDGLSYKQISEVMNIPVNTVKTKVRRGRKKILQALSPQ